MMRILIMMIIIAEVSDVSGQVYTTCEEVDYDDVVQGLQAEQSHLYIDVRETDEVQESGQIPSSKTIPRERAQL